MIFVTVGTQLSFDRLVKAVDMWAATHVSDSVYAQIGPSKMEPQHIKHARFLRANEIEESIRNSRIVVAHAGMGSILTAMKYSKPIIVMPRDSSKGEHRNGHQFATAKWLGGKSGVFVAWDVSTLTSLLDRCDELESSEKIPDFAPQEFIERLRACILSA